MTEQREFRQLVMDARAAYSDKQRIQRAIRDKERELKRVSAEVVELNEKIKRDRARLYPNHFTDHCLCPCCEPSR